MISSTTDPAPGMGCALDASLANVAVRCGTRGFTFADLLPPAAYQGATIGELSEWLAQARSSLFLVDLGFDDGQGAIDRGARRYRIANP